MLYHLDMTLGNLIKRARTEKGLTLQSLGEAVGVSRQLVNQWEKGKTDARKHILALSKALDKPIEYFYGPKRSAAVLEAKIKLLEASEYDTVADVVEGFLRRRQEAETDKPKKA